MGVRPLLRPATVLASRLSHAVIIIGSAIIYHMILVKIGGEVAWFDAFTLSIGIVATILELLRYREQYVWWIITDIVVVTKSMTTAILIIF